MRVKHFIYEELDLVKVRDMAKDANGWNDDTADRAVCRYRDFLWVCWSCGRGGAPVAWISVLADQVWHSHLQLPAAYLAASETIFGRGYILDHTPVLANGRRVSDDDRIRASDDYRELGLEVPSDLRDECIWAVVRQ